VQIVELHCLWLRRLSGEHVLELQCEPNCILQILWFRKFDVSSAVVAKSANEVVRQVQFRWRGRELQSQDVEVVQVGVDVVSALSQEE
jgi:hypothetical protein